MVNSTGCPECGSSAPGIALGEPGDLRDPTTGDIGQPLLTEAAGSVLSLARRNARTMAFLHIQLDGLTRLAATAPPGRAGRILKGVSRRLRRTVRESDLLARVGPEAFVIVLTEVWETDSAVRVAHRLVHQLTRGRAARAPLAIRIGVAFFPFDGGDIHSLLTLAGRALPEPHGRNGIGFADPVLGLEALRRAGLQRDLGGEDVARQFLLHYQPIFSAASGAPVGVEALLRWDHDHQGILAAKDFIPLAERTGRVRALDQWALEQALRDNRTWRDQGWDGWVAVNLSPRSLADARLVHEVERALAETRAEPSSLVLEVTESAALSDAATRVLHGLHELGVWVAIDDFGTGYASFEYLRKFDPDLVKLDGVFVPTADDPRERRLLHSLVRMAHHMGKPVVVEGVEDEEQRLRLLDSSCDMIQGYFLGRPVPAERFRDHYVAQVAS
jgi:diguanylate cyclase